MNDGRVSLKEIIAFMESCTIKLRDASEDDAAFYFFWPYYLQERLYNKCKKYNSKHNIDCICLQK